MSRAFLFIPHLFRPARAPLLAAAVAGLALTACQFDAPPPPAPSVAGGPAGTADAATRAACQQHAEEVYNQRNRGEIYSSQSSVNTPYSANYSPGTTTRGLPDLYSREAMIRDCVRNTGTETNRTVAPSAGSNTGAVVRP
jgi:hypothetical protein